jgi:hypothetical protein
MAWKNLYETTLVDALLIEYAVLKELDDVRSLPPPLRQNSCRRPDRIIVAEQVLLMMGFYKIIAVLCRYNLTHKQRLYCIFCQENCSKRMFKVSMLYLNYFLICKECSKLMYESFILMLDGY